MISNIEFPNILVNGAIIPKQIFLWIQGKPFKREILFKNNSANLKGNTILFSISQISKF